MAHSEHKMPQYDPHDGRLHIIDHLKEPDSFLMVVLAAGVALVVVFIMALVFLVAMGSRVIPPGHDRAGAASQTILPTTEFNAPPTMRL